MARSDASATLGPRYRIYYPTFTGTRVMDDAHPESEKSLTHLIAEFARAHRFHGDRSLQEEAREDE